MNKRNLSIIAISLAVGLFCILFVTAKLSGSMALENPIKTLNDSRSQVLVAGENYSLNNSQEEEYKEEQAKIREKIQEKKQEEDSNQNQFTARLNGDNASVLVDGQNTDSISGDEISADDNSKNVDYVEVETSKENSNSENPVIITDLKDGDSIAGLKLSFTLQGKDYKGYKIEVSNFDVKVNGVKISSSGSDNYTRKYKVDVNNGENKVVITITDKKGNKVTQSYTITANEEESQETTGNVRVKIVAKTIGKGTILDTGQSVEIHKDESIAEVTKRALDSKGIGYDMKSSGYTGAYLSRIYKSNVTTGFSIPVKLQEKLEECGATEQDYHSDSLGEFDFYKDSGWVCILNGEYLTTGTSNIDLEDGDEITWAFTLSLGREYTSTSDGGWQEEVDIY